MTTLNKNEYILLINYNMFEYLHLDMIPIIFSYLSQHELLSILLTNKFIYNQIMKYINTTKFILIDSNLKLENGCKNNLIICIKQIKIQLNWDCGLYGACEGAHESLVKLMIDKGAKDLNGGLSCACEGGHESIVKLMIEKGANHWDIGLSGACYHGHESIVKLMIEKGANDWDWGLEGACFGGHESLVKLMIEKGAKYWNWGLYGACLGGHESLVKLMIEKGAIRCDNCNKSISEHIK